MRGFLQLSAMIGRNDPFEDCFIFLGVFRKWRFIFDTSACRKLAHPEMVETWKKKQKINSRIRSRFRKKDNGIAKVESSFKKQKNKKTLRGRLHDKTKVQGKDDRHSIVFPRRLMSSSSYRMKRTLNWTKPSPTLAVLHRSFLYIFPYISSRELTGWVAKEPRRRPHRRPRHKFVTSSFGRDRFLLPLLGFFSSSQRHLAKII